MKTTWGKNLRELRLRANLSQKEFAEKLQIATVSLNRFENGHRHPDIYFLEKVARMFQVSLDWLVLDREQTRQGDPLPPVIPILEAEDILSEKRQAVPPQECLWFPGAPVCSYAMHVPDGGMRPLLHPGDLALIAAEKPARIGDMVVIRDLNGLLRIRRKGVNEGQEVFVAENPDYLSVTGKAPTLVLGTVVGRVCLDLY